MTSAQAITLAVPDGVLGVFLDQIRKTVNVVFVHMGDKYAEDGNAKGIVICNVVLPTILSFFMRFPVPFLANMYGADAVQNFMNSVPTWLTEGFSVAGGLLPALGFALTLFVIGKKQLMPLFFVGYFLVIVSKITVFEAAIFGVCVILLVMTFSYKKEEQTIGIELPAMEKDQLFPSVMTDGTLPRKTFSMGHACEKRYYIEGRKIRR